MTCKPKIKSNWMLVVDVLNMNTSVKSLALAPTVRWGQRLQLHLEQVTVVTVHHVWAHSACSTNSESHPCCPENVSTQDDKCESKVSSLQ